VSLSHRSLELRPDLASRVVKTLLGRCRRRLAGRIDRRRRFLQALLQAGRFPLGQIATPRGIGARHSWVYGSSALLLSSRFLGALPRPNTMMMAMTNARCGAHHQAAGGWPWAGYRAALASVYAVRRYSSPPHPQQLGAARGHWFMDEAIDDAGADEDWQ